jgi:hypothetical protein
MYFKNKLNKRFHKDNGTNYLTHVSLAEFQGAKYFLFLAYNLTGHTWQK